MNNMNIFRAKAPLRSSFGGGCTDVSPYPEEKGGLTLSATIDRYAYCSLAVSENDSINVHSLDYNIVEKFKTDDALVFDGKLDLVKAALKVLGIKQGVDLFLHSDVPPGSGMGSSSTMTVALVGAIKHWMRLHLDDYEIAELAYRIERQEVGIKGGKQDQYAAVFGGFNLIEFFRDNTVVNPIRIKREIINELEYRLMLCYTGKTRLSAGIIDDQVKGFQEKKIDVVKALDDTKEHANRMKKALLLNNINEFGYLLNEAWISKKNFSKKMTDPYIDELYEEARKNGVIGGKLLGAGGGGYLLLLCEFDKRHLVAQKLTQMGGSIINFAFESNGLQSWEVYNR